MIEPISGTSRNLTGDNWFTSIDLVDKLLLNHKTTYVGIISKNKRKLPLELMNTRHRPEYSIVFDFQKDKTIVSYVPKKYKNVILVSSLHHDDNIDEETNNKSKPEIITYYNKTKRLDKLCATYHGPW